MSGETPGETREVELKRAFRKARMSSRAHRVCYQLLYDLAQWKTGLIRPERQPRSMAALARKCDMSEATLRRAMAELEELGWLTRIPNPGRGNAPHLQVQVGRDAPPSLRVPMTSAERSRNYRARQKAAQENVTGDETVSGIAVVAGRESDVIRNVTCRDEFAGQDMRGAEGLRRDEGEGERGAESALTVTIAGRVHPAEACKGCVDLVPSAFAYDGRHMWCGDDVSPFAPVAEVVQLHPKGSAA